MWGAFTRTQTTALPKPPPSRFRSETCMSGLLAMEGRGWAIKCSCGWHGPTYATADGAEAGWANDHPRGSR